jgi:hypothetical protein
MHRHHGWLRGLLAVAAIGLLGGCSSDDEGDDDDGAGGGGGGGPIPTIPQNPPPVTGDWVTFDTAATWQWQLVVDDGATLDTSYDVDAYDIDLYNTSEADIAALQAAGRTVICYFSAGSMEDWRADATQFDPATVGSGLEGWPGEFWLDVRADSVRQILAARLDVAVTKGCDGVEPDNVDAYANDSGFPLTYEDQVAFNRWLANEAHTRGLAVGLKNSGEQVPNLVDYYDFELNEECHLYEECDALTPFTAAGKPIWNAEYPESDDLAGAQALSTTVCPAAQAEIIRTLILPLDLNDAFRVSCEP